MKFINPFKKRDGRSLTVRLTRRKGDDQLTGLIQAYFTLATFALGAAAGVAQTPKASLILGGLAMMGAALTFGYTLDARRAAPVGHGDLK